MKPLELGSHCVARLARTHILLPRPPEQPGLPHCLGSWQRLLGGLPTLSICGCQGGVRPNPGTSCPSTCSARPRGQAAPAQQKPLQRTGWRPGAQHPHHLRAVGPGCCAVFQFRFLSLSCSSIPRDDFISLTLVTFAVQNPLDFHSRSHPSLASWHMLRGCFATWVTQAAAARARDRLVTGAQVTRQSPCCAVLSPTTAGAVPEVCAGPGQAACLSSASRPRLAQTRKLGASRAAAGPLSASRVMSSPGLVFQTVPRGAASGDRAWAPQLSCLCVFLLFPDQSFSPAPTLSSHRAVSIDQC